MNDLRDFRAWLERDIGRFAQVAGYVEVVENDGEADGNGNSEQRLSLRLYTDSHVYRITAVEKSPGHNYLGCTANCRKPNAGEDWTRGSDLADGSLSEETWQRILADIVSFELVPLAERQDAIPVTVEN